MGISRDKGGNWEAKRGGPPTWLRVISPISNLASLRKGGKLPEKRKKGKRTKSGRSSGRR